MEVKTPNSMKRNVATQSFENLIKQLVADIPTLKQLMGSKFHDPLNVFVIAASLADEARKSIMDNLGVNHMVLAENNWKAVSELHAKSPDYGNFKNESVDLDVETTSIEELEAAEEILGDLEKGGENEV